MLIALREFSLGDRRLKPGDEVSRDEQQALPSGRVAQLKSIGLAEEQFNEALLRDQIAELQKEVRKLKADVSKLKAKKTTKKVAA